MEKATYSLIWELALPYLSTRKNKTHTKIALGFAYRLLEREKGDETIVIPGIILHDVGWKRVPEEVQLKAFGPRATMPEWNRVHEVEGAKIAAEILECVHYDKEKIAQIREIVEGHDSRKRALSLNDALVKDADKLWRYAKEGVQIGRERYNHTFDQYLDRLQSNLDKWFLTSTGKALANQEMENRIKAHLSTHAYS